MLPFSQMDDAVLIDHCRQGATDAFGELVSRYRERVYMLALQMTKNHADADELSQAAFLKAYEALGSFRKESQFFTWIYRITVNLCLTHLKSQNRFVPLPAPDPESETRAMELASAERVGEDLETDDERARVWKALDALTPDLRAAVVLVYLQDMSPRQAAKTLGCAEATVHWRMFKARKILKRLLK